MRNLLLAVAMAAILLIGSVPADSAMTPGVPDLGTAPDVDDAALAIQQLADGQQTDFETDFTDTGQGPEFYIVQLQGEPLAVYRGGVRSLAATSPVVTGEARLDARSEDSLAYLDYLAAAQNRFVATVERILGHEVDVAYRYRHVLNGVALWLDPAEAGRVAALPGVSSVVRNRYDHIQTDAGPAWIGAPGVWDGTTTGGLPGTMGEGVIVGIVDTGINMDHPSFAAVGGDGYQHVNPFGAGNYVGWCDPANENYDPKYVCNDKLIGVWSFEASGADPEDDHGHGSHTASTTAGNVIDGAALVAPTITITRAVRGVAPHANIIAYDVCDGGCPEIATTAAIDQAAADGVHVINYSITTSRADPWSSSNVVLAAFRNARAAGVLASVAAANNGPAAATTNAIAPWVMAVGATTHNRKMSNALVEMSGGAGDPPGDIVGKSLTAGYGPAPIVYAAGYMKADDSPDDGRCLEAFPDGTFDGEIVVCDRGVIARVAKGANVLAGGAGGLVLANAASNGASLTADGHALPAVHITYQDGQALKEWLADGEGHVASIAGTGLDERAINGDVMAGFSSRGPTRAYYCCRRPGIDLLTRPVWLDVLRPDVSTPGVDVMAAVDTDPDKPAEQPEFGLKSGTSMAAPHAAGAAALMRALHPDWSPAEVQSALTTTALREGQRKEDEVTPSDPFDHGGGRIDLSQASRAGLVLDVTMDDFAAADKSQGGDPSSLNLASLANFGCLGTCEWTRTVSSTLAMTETWAVEATADDGLGLEVAPGEFTIEPGGTQEIHVTADVTGLELDQWAFGEIQLTPGGDDVPDAHLPVAVHSVVSKLPNVVLIEAPYGTGDETVEDLLAIDAPQLMVTGYGFAAGVVTEASLEQDPTGNAYDLGDQTGTLVVLVDVPEGARRLVAEITGSEAPNARLRVGRDLNDDGVPQNQSGNREQVCTSLSGSWHEYCDVRDPAPGQWWILVQNYRGSGDQPDDVALAAAVVPAVNTGNLYPSGPPTAVLGEPFDLTIGYEFQRLDVGDMWYGILDIGSNLDSAGDIGTIGLDLIGIEPPPPPPAIYLPYAAHNAPAAGIQ